MDGDRRRIPRVLYHKPLRGSALRLRLDRPQVARRTAGVGKHYMQRLGSCNGDSNHLLEACPGIRAEARTTGSGEPGFLA
jgi:hypothetical protein